MTRLIALLVPSADCVDLPPNPRVYADDAHAFRPAVDRDQRKEAALPMIQTQPTQRLQPKSPTQELQQQQTTGISIHLKANDERPRLPQAEPSQPARSQLAVSPGPDSEFTLPVQIG